MTLQHSVSGDLTLNTATRQLAEGLDAIKRGCVEFDFSAVAKLDSAALAFILACQRSANASNQKLHFLHLPANLKNLATLYGVAPFLDI
jgi:phospholipid transport system transporter-binding protein